MAPARMVSQWMMLPVTMALVGVAGVSVGLFSAWANQHSLQDGSWPTAIGASIALWIVLPVIAGIVTNSWTIAAILGSVAMLAARLAEPVGDRIFTETYAPPDWPQLMLHGPLALLGGAILGWAGSAWRHENGPVRALAASITAGSLGWTAWEVLEGEWSRSGPANQVAWATLVIAAAVILLCRTFSMILLAIASAVIVGGVLVFGARLEGTTIQSRLDSFFALISDWLDDFRR